MSGPAGLSAIGLGMDPGTLIRAFSSVPGPIIENIQDMLATVYGAAADVEDWTVDALNLYVRLLLEGGLGALGVLAFGLEDSLDTYFTGGENLNQPWSGGANIGRFLDQRFAAMAKAHNQFAKAHKVSAMGPMLGWAATWFADTSALKKLLLLHYLDGQGKDYVLHMGEVLMDKTHMDFFNVDIYSKEMAGPLLQAQNASTSFKTPSAQADWKLPIQFKVSAANDGLGNFEVKLDGVLRFTSDPIQGETQSPYLHDKSGVKLEPADVGLPLIFEGEMTWHDFWNFDTKLEAMFSSTSVGRSKGGEASVVLVAGLLDGVPFNVDSVPIPVKQYAGRFPIY